jgi:hypothetical protein
MRKEQTPVSVIETNSTPRGAPPRYADRRQTFTFRITDQMRDSLKQAVKISGRSLSSEIEYRLERSFWEDDVSDRLLRRLFKSLGRAVEMEE